ncbi:MAG: hypothetical protein JW746_05405 [Candidatus Krumholzibacteriota bacterium]|nr:hypothetical protein [Candidatus Krumholzibacteriota bacterium]
MTIKKEEGRESARIEHCPSCNSVLTKNNIYFCRGETPRVYVECAECGIFVARYALISYTSDKSYESLLRKMRFTRANSGKRTMKMIEGFETSVKKEFEHVLELVKTDEDKRHVEDIIAEDYSNEED